MIKTTEYLFTYDYDLTGFDAFKITPGFIDVPTAVKFATEDLFGETGLNTLYRQGGLKNRASSELVHDLLHDPEVDAEGILSSALGFITENQSYLEQVMPRGKGTPIIFGEIVDQSEIAEAWTRQKLGYMLDQIGKPLLDGELWPRPTRGFKRHWEGIDRLSREGINIKRAIVSSGHHSFIERTFEAHKLTPPDIIVSEDDIRGDESLRNQNIVKPAIFPLALAVRRWQNLPVNSNPTANKQLISELSDRIIYFGDDPIKDGQMADSAGIKFGNFNQSLEFRPMKPGKFEFNDWIVADSFLLKGANALLQGEPIKNIFNHE